MPSSSGERGWAERRAQGMGTVMTHRAFGPHADDALEAVLACAAELEQRMSRFAPASDISAINRAAGGGGVQVGSAVIQVLERALQLSRSTHGLFDVTIGPLVDVWRVTRRDECGVDWPVPGETDIRACIQLVDYRDLTLDIVRGTAALRRAGQCIDLGGIAKGYAADAFAQVFRTMGVTCAFTNIGGNVMTVGAKPGGAPWRVGIEHPRSQGRLIGAIDVAGMSVVTSGDYHRFFIDQDGVRQSHILDPRTGRPARSGLISATVMSPCSMDADALSTAVFVAGIEAAHYCTSRHNVEGMMLVDEDMTVWVSKRLQSHFTAVSGLTVRTI